MSNKALEDYSVEEVFGLLQENCDAVVLVDSEIHRYRALRRRGIFESYVDEYGDYHELIQKLWFHLYDSNEEITDDYKAFISFYDEYQGKYSRRFKIFVGETNTPYIGQMTVYPMKDAKKYIFVMNVLDDGATVDNYMTDRKVNTIQNTFLFSMYVDLIRDTTSSISITEISEDTVNSKIKYSQWRMMVVNMIWPEDQAQFLRRTDPDYLKEHLAPGRVMSFDCLMKNLEGVYIWVKLIFSRTKTRIEDDFRFVFMVQNIHDNAVELMSTLEKYEELAITDALTGLLNYGGIKTEMLNAIDIYKKDHKPVSFVMLDLDFFKNVNDTYGHSAGDAVLKEFANILTEAVKDKKASVGRWGGEEFMVVCQEKTAEELNKCAEDLRKIVEENDFPGIGHLTCSIGVTQLRENDSFEDAFDRVDKALYESKNTGRNKVTML